MEYETQKNPFLEFYSCVTLKFCVTAKKQNRYKFNEKYHPPYSIICFEIAKITLYSLIVINTKTYNVSKTYFIFVPYIYKSIKRQILGNIKIK